MDTRRNPKKVSKGDVTREAMKRAAKRVFAVGGFHSAKIVDITAEASRSPGAFYRYFDSKETLLSELLDEFQAQLKQAINRPLAPDQSALENIESSVRMFWRIYRENWPIATASFQLSMVNRDFARAWRNFRQNGIRALGTVIRKAQREGFCPGLDTELAASALCSMIEYSCYNWTANSGDYPERNVDDTVAVEVLRMLVLNAIGWRDEKAAKVRPQNLRKSVTATRPRSPLPARLSRKFSPEI